MIKHEVLAPLTATAVFPPPVAAFIAYSDQDVNNSLRTWYSEIASSSCKSVGESGRVKNADSYQLDTDVPGD